MPRKQPALSLRGTHKFAITQAEGTMGGPRGLNANTDFADEPVDEPLAWVVAWLWLPVALLLPALWACLQIVFSLKDVSDSQE